jgi:hypothetical protein
MQQNILELLSLSEGMESETLTTEHEGETFEYTGENYNVAERSHRYGKKLRWGVPTQNGIDEHAATLERHAKRFGVQNAAHRERIKIGGERLYWGQRLDDERNS